VRRALVVGVVLGTYCAAIACGQYGVSATEVTDASPDASQEAAVTPDASDALAEVSPSSCVTIVEDDFQDPSKSAATWRFLGAARIDDAGAVELVPDLQNQTGAIWMAVTKQVQSELHVKVDTFVSGMDVVTADGLAFAWSSQAQPSLGGAGSQFALCNAGNDAVATVMNSLGGSVMLLDVQGSDCPTLMATSAPILGAHALDLRIRGTTVVALIDQKPFAFAAREIAVGSVGFTGATGNDHARHTIDNVFIETCANGN
jgi:hypothetical protein